MARQICVIVPLVGLMLLAGAVGADTYSGTLEYDTGLDATLNWADTDLPTSISWVVSRNPNGSWHYEYTLATPGPAISHWILELTDPVFEGDLLNFSGDYNKTETKLHAAGPGNPNMPEDVYGIKFEWDEGGNSETISFDSWRLPVWQDFYAKCGGQVNTVWNLGFTAGDTDPLDPPRDGSIDDHILAPDGYVPEPATTALFGLGLAGLIGARLRRRREN